MPPLFLHSVVVSFTGVDTMFFFSMILFDIYPDALSKRRKLDFLFSAVLSEVTYCSFLATIASIVFVSLPNRDNIPSSVDDKTLWSPRFLIVFMIRHFLASIVVMIEAFTNYHYYHGKLWPGLLLVSVYGLAYALWHLCIFEVSHQWPYYFEAMLSSGLMVLVAVIITLVRLPWYHMWRVILRRRWRRHIDRDLAFVPHRERRTTGEIPSFGSSAQWRSSMSSTLHNDEDDDANVDLNSVPPALLR